MAASLIALPDVWKSQVNMGNSKNLPRQNFWIEKEDMLGKHLCIAWRCLVEGGVPSTLYLLLICKQFKQLAFCLSHGRSVMCCKMSICAQSSK